MFFFSRIERTVEFQSTPSVGRATQQCVRYFSVASISIHALRGEGDLMGGGFWGNRQGISIHALRGEGDLLSNLIC